MCATSAVVDYYSRRSQMPGVPAYPYNPMPVLPPVTQWDPVAQQLLREALQKLDQLDKRLQDLECNEPAKEKLKGIIGDWE